MLVFKRGASVAIVSILILSSMILSTGISCETAVFKPNSYYKWLVELWAYPKGLIQQGGAGIYKKIIWRGILYLEITSIEQSGESYLLSYKYLMNYTYVKSSKYTKEDAKARIQEGVGESLLNGSLSISSDNYDYRLGTLNWGFNISFLVTPLIFFNPSKKGFIEWFKENYMKLRLGVIERVSGIVYESWDLILGTYREVYYIEIFVPAANLRPREPISVNASILEFDTTIDRELGFIGYLRIYWEYSEDVSFEIIAKIIDTNVIPHNIFYYTIATIIVVIIVAVFAYKYYRRKKRLRLIRV